MTTTIAILIGAYIAIAIVTMLVYGFFAILGSEHKTIIGFIIATILFGAFWPITMFKFLG